MKKRIIILLLIILTAFSPLAYRFSKYYKIACNQYANTALKGEITSEINRRISDYLNEKNLSYNSIANISYNEDKKISSVSVNSVKLSEIALDISELIFTQAKASKEAYSFPIGNAFGLRSLSGKGPNISVNVIPLSAVNYRIESQLLSSGINQTLHRIFIVLETEVACLAPLNETNIKIETTVIIAETLIVGDIPQVILPFSE